VKKNFFVIGTFLCSHKFHKIVNYFIFEIAEENNLGQFSKNLELFTQKIVTKLSKIWLWDPGSEIRDPRSGIPGGQKGTGFRIPDPDLQLWYTVKEKGGKPGRNHTTFPIVKKSIQKPQV
jgi:hypothetical protein